MIATRYQSLVSTAADYAKKILSQLPEELAFHNLEHTQMVVDASRFMQEWWMAGVAILAIIFFGYKEAHKRSEAIQDGQERLMLKYLPAKELSD